MIEIISIPHKFEAGERIKLSHIVDNTVWALEESWRRGDLVYAMVKMRLSRIPDKGKADEMNRYWDEIYEYIDESPVESRVVQ